MRRLLLSLLVATLLSHCLAGRYCCNAPSPIRRANTRAVFPTPVQVQAGCAGTFCASSGVTAVETPDTVPYVVGYPNPDPNGTQVYNMLIQTEQSFSELGLRGGRDNIAWYHLTTINAIETISAMLDRYLSFIAQSNYVPALSWHYYPNDDLRVSSFNFQADAKALNVLAYKGLSCDHEFMPINIPDIPKSEYYSHAFLSGRDIYTSTLVATDHDNLSVYQQTTAILCYIKKILDTQYTPLDNLIQLEVFINSMSQKDEMESAYFDFFQANPVDEKPLYALYGNVTFVIPGQVGADVGIRAIAFKRYPYCDDEVIKFNVNEIYHENRELSSMGAVVQNTLHFAGIYGTINADGPWENPNPDRCYYDAFHNVLKVGGRMGAGLADLLYMNHYYEDPLNGYNQIAEGTAKIYNGTNFHPYVYAAEGAGEMPPGHRFGLTGQFYMEDNNYEVIPSSYPWEINGLLLYNYFKEILPEPIPLEFFRNNTFCTLSSLTGCAKPGYNYNNYPLSPYSSLGEQKLKGV